MDGTKTSRMEDSILAQEGDMPRSHGNPDSSSILHKTSS